MVDYAIANQIRPFQLPDIAGIAGAMQGLELNRMRSQQLQAAEQERNALRQLMATPGFDPASPDAARRLLTVAPTTGAATYQALMAGQRERRQAEGSGLENAVKLTQSFRDLLPTATAENYPALRAAAVAAVPGWAPSWPETYNADAVRALMQKADDKLKEYGVNITATQGGTGFVASPTVLPRGAAPLQGPTFIPAESIPAAPPPAAPGAPAPRAQASGLTPGQTAAADFLRRREGFREAPYYDVNAYRAGFGSDTTTLADGTVVPVRQGMTVSREDAERDLARRVPEFTQRAAAAIGEDRFAALPPNAQAALISIAYNYGTLPGRIREAARSGDLAALSQAVAGLAGDNQGVNAGRRREEAAMIAGGNAMAPGAAPVNAMLAPQDATAVTGMPQLPTFGPPRTLAEADYQKRMMDAIAELEKKRIEADRARAARRDDAPAVAAEAGMTAAATARAQADVRREEQPARVQEAGQTTEAQERARIQTRETEARRAETEKLNTAISELERISRPGGLLERSTGSGVGRLVDLAGEFIGVSSRGAQAAAALAPIADVVLKMVPRFEGPQSDKDTAAYQAAAGRLADPTIPNETRLAAAREIVRLMRARRDQFSYTPGGATTPTAAPAAQTAPPVPAGVGMTQDNWSRLWGVMTPQERALWQN